MNDLAQELQQAKTVIEWQKETIKGLDRATVHHTACFAKLEEIIKTQDNTIEQRDATIKDLTERLEYHLEAQASIPTPDINGTIKAQQSLISKLKRDVMTLQAKVQEQDEQLATWKVQPST